MRRIPKIVQKYREALNYLFFGGLTTLVNLSLFMGLKSLTSLSTDAANALALAASILFAYFTNRRWVFESRLTGWAAVREFAFFLACRIATGFLDQGVVVLGVDHLGASLNLSSNMLWVGSVKLFANALVILANYVFSKLLIFRKKS